MKAICISTVVATLAIAAIAQTKITTETQTTIMVEVKEDAPPTQREACKVALVVQNHAVPGTSIPMMALTDALTAKLSGRGFQVINPYNCIGENMNRSVQGEALPRMSAFELAQEVGADGAITASVLEILDSTFGTVTKLHQFSIRISLNFADVSTGAGICGETVDLLSQKYTSNQVAANKTKYLNDLLYAAAEECATKLEESAKTKNWPVAYKSLQSGSSTGINREPKVRRWGALTVEDLNAGFNALVSDMIASPLFVKNYGDNKTALDRAPVAIIGGVEDSANLGLSNMLGAVSTNIRIQLFNSKLFEVKDDAVETRMSDRILSGGKSLLEDGELLQALKQHGSPDYLVLGDVKPFADYAGRQTFQLHLAFYDLATGKIVWEGINTISKGR